MQFSVCSLQFAVRSAHVQCAVCSAVFMIIVKVGSSSVSLNGSPASEGLLGRLGGRVSEGGRGYEHMTCLQ